MPRIKALLWALLALPVAGIGVWFAQDNSALVSLVLLGFPVGELPLAIWVTLAFFVGVLAAVLATLPALAAALRYFCPPAGCRAAGGGNAGGCAIEGEIFLLTVSRVTRE